MAIAIRTPKEIEKIREANRVVAKTLDFLRGEAKSGVSLKELDKKGEEFIRGLGATPSFKNLYGFPSAVCLSLNQVIIHGVPYDYRLQEGDILGIDLGANVDGWYGDGAITVGIGEISKEDQSLIDCAKDTLSYAVSIVKDGMRFKELKIGRASCRERV